MSRRFARRVRQERELPRSLRSPVALLGVLPLLLAVAHAACSEPAAEPAACSGAACGTGGSGGVVQQCPDHAESSRCRSDGAQSGCGEEVCALAADHCPPGEACCTLPLECTAAVGSRAGGIRCDDDDQCESGFCAEVGGVKSCLRACLATAGTDSCPLGQHCETFAFAAGAGTSTCVGGAADARDPETTVCTRPAQCPDGRVCKIVNGAQTEEGTAFALCLPPSGEEDFFASCAPQPGSGISPGIHGSVGSRECDAGGLCWDACRGRVSYACICTPEQLDEGTCRAFRCTGPCGTDGDCPDRTVCQGTNQTVRDMALAFSVCRLPEGAPLDWACWDELDCCKDGLRADGAPCCFSRDGSRCDTPPDPAQETTCRLSATATKFMTQCQLPGGLAAQGDPCTDHAECESGLCTEDGAGLGCAAVCDLRFDRCPQIVPGTTCCPTLVTAGGGPHCVPTCSTSCASPPTCELDQG